MLLFSVLLQQHCLLQESEDPRYVSVGEQVGRRVCVQASEWAGMCACRQVSGQVCAHAGEQVGRHVCVQANEWAGVCACR